MIAWLACKFITLKREEKNKRIETGNKTKKKRVLPFVCAGQKQAANI
jgi:hypothetical protein